MLFTEMGSEVSYRLANIIAITFAACNSIYVRFIVLIFFNTFILFNIRADNVEGIIFSFITYFQFGVFKVHLIAFSIFKIEWNAHILIVIIY